jgi:hypothetical protein
MIHRHHIIPKRLGGTDALENIALLTVVEHAEAHYILWLLQKRWQDFIAFAGLSGWIGKEEIMRNCSRLANIGRAPWHKGKKIGPRTEETKRKISETLKARGHKPSPETMAKGLAAAHAATRGCVRSPQLRKQISQSLKQFHKNKKLLIFSP